jgi:hypothetical protein
MILYLDLTNANFERAAEKWSQLYGDHEKRDAGTHRFEVFRIPLANGPHLVFQRHGNHIEIVLRYYPGSTVGYRWPIDRLPSNSDCILDAFYKDKRRSRSIDKYRDWLLKEFHNFINLFAVVEREEIQDELGYDS